MVQGRLHMLLMMSYYHKMTDTERVLSAAFSCLHFIGDKLYGPLTLVIKSNRCACERAELRVVLQSLFLICTKCP